MSDEEFPVEGSSSLAAAAAVANVGDRDKRAPRFSWTPAYEATFFRSLCESVQLGLRENHSFKAEAWDRAAIALQQKHGAMPAKSHLVNKSDNARKKFRLWRGLREDPDFLYNPNTRTVTATEDAWKAHIEKEPLSRALRGRPFEHEEFMEILYPDVIGSGGAPKRIMKPKRKADDNSDTPQISDDPDMSTASLADITVDTSFRRPSSQHGLSMQQQPTASMAPVAQLPVALPTAQPQVQQQRPTSTAMPPRGHIGGSSALTPPEETANRSKFPGTQAAQQQSAAGEVNNAPTAPMGPPAGRARGQPADKRRRVSSIAQNGHSAAAAAVNGTSTPGGASSFSSSSDANATESSASLGQSLIEHGLLRIEDAIKARAPPRWPEQALDIFFREFAGEDMDLQLKIAEKALADETKAMVFCKMPPPLRKHWVKRLREVHNNRVT